MLSYPTLINFGLKIWHQVKTNHQIHRLLLVSIMLLIAIFVLIGFKSRFHSFYFQDETDHVTVGWMMWRFDRQLYLDLSTNHMPIPIFLGAFLSRVISFNSLYQLIAGLRQSMWLIWTVFALFATWRFRSAGAISFTFLLLLNFYYFGFHVLTDPIGAMGVAIMTLYLMASLWQKKQLSSSDGLIFGLCAALAWFSILTVWPFVLVTFILVWWSQMKWFKLSSLIAILLIVGMIFSYVTPQDWWRETVVNNLIYVLPDQSSFSNFEKVGILLFPLTVITQPTNQQSVLIFGIFVFTLWLWSQWWRHSTDTKIKKTTISLLTLFLLITLNTRVPHTIYVFYRGIHALPYLAGLVSVLGGLFVMVRPRFSQAQKIATYSFLLFLVTFSGRYMYENIDQLNDYYIQYGEYESTGVALGRLKNQGDSLMTGPDGYGYINQMADLPLFGKQNFHLSWSFYVPYLHEYFFDQFAKNPPTFIFFRPGGDPHYQAIMPQLKTDYVRLKRQVSTNDIEMYELYMLKSEINKHSLSQWMAFQNIGFRIPVEYIP